MADKELIEHIGIAAQRVADSHAYLHIDDKTVELQRLDAQIASPGFWDDASRAQSVSKQASNLRDVIAGACALLDDVRAAAELADEDESFAEEAKSLLAKLDEELDGLEVSSWFSGRFDAGDAILSVNPGSGGLEAQDWTDMLFRMYRRYCEKSGYQVEILDYLAGDEAGVKSVTFRAVGENAYGFLKAEKGVHRLVRISPFDANSRRHTSFSALEVMPEIEDEGAIVIPPEDIEIETRRSTGAGGQHINKTESAIRILHKPTGIVVQCQQERSQIQNRETAMNMLRSKLIELREREREEKELELRGDIKKIEWGSQIRSYVFHPYNMVKDHRTNVETSNIQAVMDGELEPFIRAYLGKKDREQN